MQIATKHKFIHFPIAYEMPFISIVMSWSSVLLFFVIFSVSLCYKHTYAQFRGEQKKTNKVQGEIRRKFIACENEISTNKLLFDRSVGLRTKKTKRKQSVEIEKCSVIQ